MWNAGKIKKIQKMKAYPYYKLVKADFIAKLIGGMQSNKVALYIIKLITLLLMAVFFLIG